MLNKSYSTVSLTFNVFHLQFFNPILEQSCNLDMRTKAASLPQDPSDICLTTVTGTDFSVFLPEHRTEPEHMMKLGRLEEITLWLGQQKAVVARRIN